MEQLTEKTNLPVLFQRQLITAVPVVHTIVLDLTVFQGQKDMPRYFKSAFNQFHFRHHKRDFFQRKQRQVLIFQFPAPVNQLFFHILPILKGKDLKQHIFVNTASATKNIVINIRKNLSQKRFMIIILFKKQREHIHDDHILKEGKKLPISFPQFAAYLHVFFRVCPKTSRILLHIGIAFFLRLPGL